MQPHRYARVKEVLLDLLDLDPEQREEALAQANLSDPSIRQEVRDLLELGPMMTESFLEHSPVELSSLGEGKARPELVTGSQIGKFRIDRRLGLGGMGEVYAGTDETLKRPVAIKVMRAAGRLSASQRTRFLTEARVLSALRHPNVCQVYDFLEGSDRDVLILELIDGETLRAHLAKGTPANPLDLAIQVAAALEVAHANGVTHRDLKPENIMVTAEGTAKVLDFGLSRIEPVDAAADLEALPDEGVTSDGMVMGTLGYMAPEQALGQTVGPAADLYAFGLLLQELLTGQLPFDRGPGLLERSARGESYDPEGLGPEITALILRLKAVDANLRPTAQDALRQLEEIAELPAKRRRQRLQRAAFAAVVAVAITLAALTVTIANGARKTEAARVEAQAALDFLVDLIESADPSRARGKELTVAEVLENGAVRLETDLADLPLARARLQHTIGVVDLHLERLPRSRELLENSLATRLENLSPSHPDVLETQSRLAAVELALSEPLAAQERLASAIQIAEEAFGASSEEYADLLVSQLRLENENSKHPKAAETGLRAAAIFEERLGPDSPKIAAALRGVSRAYVNMRQFNDAAQLQERAIAISRAALGGDHPDIVSDLYALSLVYNYQGKFEQGEALLLESESMARRLYGEQHTAVAKAMVDRAQVLREIGKPDEAIALAEKAIAIQETLDRDYETVYCLRSFQSILTLEQRHEYALRIGLRVWETRRRILQEGHPELGIDDLQLAVFLVRVEHRADALRLMLRSLPQLEKAVEENPKTYTEPRDIALEQIALLEASIESDGPGTPAPPEMLSLLQITARDEAAHGS